MASSPIISWQTEREKVEAVTDSIFLTSKITVDGESQHHKIFHLVALQRTCCHVRGNLHNPRDGDVDIFCCSVAKLCMTLCDPMDCSMPGYPVLHYLLELAQTHSY